MDEENKSSKIVRIRKRSTTRELAPEKEPQPSVSLTKRKKVLRVAKKLSDSETLNSSSIQEDFVLEKEGDVTNFLKEKDPQTGEYLSDLFTRPELDDNGNLKPTSFVGPRSLFEKKSSTASLSQSQLPEKTTLVQKSLVRMLSPKIDPKERFQEKIKSIEEGKALEKQRETEKLNSMTLGEQINYARQTRILENFQRTIFHWKKIEKNLSSKSRKDESQLVANRASEYREKIEEYDFLDRKLSSKERMGNRAWYMTLRNEENCSDTYIQVGNKFYALFTRITARSGSEKEIIRKPGEVKFQGKTFKQFPYFREKLQEDTDHWRTLTQEDFTELTVVGQAKYPLELEAANRVGSQYVRPDLVQMEDVEETIEENYDVKLKY